MVTAVSILIVALVVARALYYSFNEEGRVARRQRREARRFRSRFP